MYGAHSNIRNFFRFAWHVTRLGFVCIFFLFLPSVLLYYADGVVNGIVGFFAEAMQVRMQQADPTEELWESLAQGSYYLSLAAEYLHRLMSYGWDRVHDRISEVNHTSSISLLLISALVGFATCVSLGLLAILVYVVSGKTPLYFGVITFRVICVTVSISSMILFGLMDLSLLDLRGEWEG